MSNRDNFGSGFLLGTLVGGLVGGAIGAIVGSKLSEETPLPENGTSPDIKPRKLRKRQRTSEESIETARRSLENKIAQLNEAIDDVRQQLSNVNGAAVEGEIQPSSLPKDP